jgi:hypothetical protein
MWYRWPQPSRSENQITSPAAVARQLGGSLLSRFSSTKVAALSFAMHAGRAGSRIRDHELHPLRPAQRVREVELLCIR